MTTSSNMLRLRLPFALIAALALSACAPQASEPAITYENPDAPSLPMPEESELSALLAGFDVPGMAYAQLTACKIDGVVVAGTANLETGAPVTPDTAFEAASMSKPVFAWLVMSLVDEGVIALDTPLADTFDYDRIPDKDAYGEITPRLVLTHRTGLPNWVDEETDFHDRTAPIPFGSAPGTAFSYSGEGFQLLQAYVERETGQTLETLFQERLGDVMPNSTFVQPLPDTVTPSRGYQLASTGDGGRDLQDPAGAMSASSLFTTAGDYARFLSHVCQKQGLEPETYDLMLEAQSPAPPGEQPMPASWSLGWMIAEIGPDETFVGHGGNNDEYRSLAGYLAESGDGVVLLTNGARGDALINALLIPAEP